jgi:amino acid permease
MAEPEKVKKMLNLSLSLVTGWFLFMSALGYWMFGTGTKEEIIFNIAQEPAYNKALTAFLLWLIVLNPLTKVRKIFFTFMNFKTNIESLSITQRHIFMALELNSFSNPV